MASVSGLRSRWLGTTDPRLTATIYADPKLLPFAGELAKVPAIPDQPPNLLQRNSDGQGLWLAQSPR